MKRKFEVGSNKKLGPPARLEMTSNDTDTNFAALQS
jgi:hypothetical protein